jgi:NAD(P)-dependent dehydrogenase (short-subunit alcohol dehydrogenase family)
MGKEFARALLAEGLTVYAAARRLEQMADLAALGAVILKMDVTREDEVQAAVRRIEQDHGGVDVLINNAAAIGLHGSVEETGLDEARAQVEVNLFGMARVTQLVLPSMRAKRRGTIINISSMGGRSYTPLGGWYHATKHAVEGWSDCLRLELRPFNIDVVIIEPGAIATNPVDVLMGPLLQRSGNGPYGRMARAVAASAKRAEERHLASDPQVIVRLVLRAIRARRPRTRYAGGRYARVLMWSRHWLGDRLFDRMVLRALT